MLDDMAAKHAIQILVITTMMSMSDAVPYICGTSITARVADKPGAAMIPGYVVRDSAGEALEYSTGTVGFAVERFSSLVIVESALQAGSIGKFEMIATDVYGNKMTQPIEYTVFADTANPVISGNMSATVPLGSPPGTLVTTHFVVVDLDQRRGDGFTYEIEDNSEFSIGLFDGKVRTKTEMPDETSAPFSLYLTLQVTVRDSKRTAATANLMISIVNSSNKIATTYLELAFCIIGMLCIRHIWG